MLHAIGETWVTGPRGREESLAAGSRSVPGPRNPSADRAAGFEPAPLVRHALDRCGRVPFCRQTPAWDSSSLSAAAALSAYRFSKALEHSSATAPANRGQVQDSGLRHSSAGGNASGAAGRAGTARTAASDARPRARTPPAGERRRRCAWSPESDPDYYHDYYPFAVELTTSGTYVHYSDGDPQPGHSAGSHGCVHLSMANAQWFYAFARQGDPVTITGSASPAAPADNGYADYDVTDWSTWISPNASGLGQLTTPTTT